MTSRVLDTSALMSGRPFEGELFTTDEVLQELRRLKALTPQLTTFLDVKVRILSPSRESVAAMEAASEGTGDAHRLSPTDIGLLAVAADVGGTIVTDDYSIQNLAEVVGVAYEPVLQMAIKEVVRWQYRCSGCARPFESWTDPCPVCGSKLRTVRARG